MNFDRIKEIAYDKKISIPTIAEKIGMSKKGLYASIENKTLKVETLEKIAEVLGVPISRFMYLDELFPPPPDPKITVLENEVVKLEKRIKELEEQLDDKRKLISWHEGKDISMAFKVTKDNILEFRLNEIWQYYLNETDKEFPLFRKLLLTPILSRDSNFKKEYFEAANFRSSKIKEKLLNDSTIKKYLEDGYSFEELQRLRENF